MNRLASLIDGIIDACRSATKNCASYKDGEGAIRVCVIPQGAWRTEQPEFIASKVDRFEAVARIDPQGNYVLNRGTNDVHRVDTYAFSAMKVATMLHAMELEQRYYSGPTRDISVCEGNGFAPYLGAICYELYTYDEISSLVVVSVAGKRERDDEFVAKAAINAIYKWCNDGPINECGKPICGYRAPWLQK